MTVYIISAIIWGIVWGIATNAIIQNKGYNENWFWWGFFFSIIAALVAISKPENRKSYDYSNDSSSLGNGGSFYTREYQDNKVLSDGGWKCICGRLNNSFTGTCACGRTKEEVKKFEEEEKQKQIEQQNETEELNRLNAIKELKSLLDTGAITQEEFEAKKKSLLGL